MKKRKYICLTLLLCGLLFHFAGCGGQEAPQESGEMGEVSAETKELVINAGTSGRDIYSETEELFLYEAKAGEMECELLNMQYYEGEPVQLWLVSADQEGIPVRYKETTVVTTGEAIVAADKLTEKLQLYLFREDGTRELLIEDILADDHHTPYSSAGGLNISDCNLRREDFYLYSGWYVDRDKACYCWWNTAGPKERNNGEYTFMKIEPSGEVAYDVLLEDGVRVDRMFRLPDNRMLIILKDENRNETRIAEFDPNTGVLGGVDVALACPWQPGGKMPCNYMSYFGADGEGNLYLMTSHGTESGIYRVDLSDGSVSEAVSFTGTTYTIGSSTMEDSPIEMQRNYKMGDLLVLPDGSARVLWSRRTIMRDYYNLPSVVGVEETLRPVSADRPAVTIRAESFTAWMKQQAARFNRSNTRWQAVLEEYASSNAVDLGEYARLTSVQIATGKGPDMLFGSFMDSYVPGMLEKGVLLELSGPLREAGVRMEEYLPLAFDVWRMGDSVYGITAEPLTPLIYTIDSRVLGGGAGEPDTASLIRALQAWEEDSALLGKNDSSENLRRFLQGSEDLWGMLDWEKGTCDFGGELFEGMLEVSKRYGYEENLKKPNLMRTTQLNNIYAYMSREGRTVCGILYDDGSHGTVTGARALMVNAVSDAREGALEFLSFLLGENVQKVADLSSFPVRREQLKECVRLQVERTAGGAEVKVDVSYIDGGEMVKDERFYKAEDVTEDRIREYLDALENVKAAPARNRPIIDIICEEAEYYFNGDKPIREVVKVIESKVGLYLMERQ